MAIASTTDELARATNEQTIADSAYFAQHAVFPGHGSWMVAAWLVLKLLYRLSNMAMSSFGAIPSSGVIHAVLGYSEW